MRRKKLQSLELLFSVEVKQVSFRRHLFRALLFSLGVNLLYYIVFPVLNGIYLTYAYEPQITDAYRSAEVLQNEVAFGAVYRTPGLYPVFTLLLGMALYAILLYAVRFVRRRSRST